MESILHGRWFTSLLLGWLVFAPTCLAAGDNAAWALRTNALITSEGVFLDDLALSIDGTPLPRVRCADAPAFGQSLIWSRAQVANIIAKTGMAAPTNWSGATRVSISRRSRILGEADVLALMRTTLQEQYVKTRGDLELRLTRPWTPVRIPDESLTLRVLDLPGSGISSFFILRFELIAANVSVGTWQAPLQARVWREILVARQQIRRGDALVETDFIRERRDQLTTRESLGEFPEGPAVWELMENLQPGQALTSRSARLRPVVRRGQSAEGLVQDGALNISLKVEILEDGAPGQTVRARNPQSRREFRGKVIDEKSLQLLL